MTGCPQGEGKWDEEPLFARHQYFPGFLNASFLNELSLIHIKGSNPTSFDQDVELEKHLRSIAARNDQQFMMQSTGLLEGCGGLSDYTMDNFNWMEIGWKT